VQDNSAKPAIAKGFEGMRAGLRPLRRGCLSASPASVDAVLTVARIGQPNGQALSNPFRFYWKIFF
jgi:hypothetical protein